MKASIPGTRVKSYRHTHLWKTKITRNSFAFFIVCAFVFYACTTIDLYEKISLFPALNGKVVSNPSFLSL